MPVIPHTDLHNNLAAILRRVETGEEFTITVVGRPVAHLGPSKPREWVSAADLVKLWQTPAPQTEVADLKRFPGELADPFSEPPA